MNSITIITIVVVAFLTVIIFSLTWLAYVSCLKMYKFEVDAGKHDAEILEQYHSAKKGKSGLIVSILSYIALALLLTIFVIGIIYTANNEQLIINNQTALVIKTGSMSEFYDDKRALENNNDTSLQFDIGDICIFSKDFELHKGEVYGYKFQNTIITHRLIAFDETTGLCEFQGDANSISDKAIYGLIPKENVIYHYTGKKIPGVGAFVLYAKSYFGIWSLLGIMGITISSEIIYYRINKINKARDQIIYVEPTIEEDSDHEE